MKEGKGGRMNKTKEKLSKIKLKYPEIREILQKLYTSAYRSGQAIKDKGDSYDHSTAYEEIEKALDSMREETLREVELQSKIVKPHSSDTLEQIQNNFIQIGYNRAVIDLEDFINNLKTKNEKTQ